ncbi:hypothetical protein GCM10010415_65070 [Streptomyces atrovirens]
MKEPAVDGVPATVTCRVLKLAGQPYHRRLDKPVTDPVPKQAHRANALFDAHREDPEFGCRFLAGEARSSEAAMAGRTAWRIRRDNHWWSVFGKKRGGIKKAGPPVHDDLVAATSPRTARTGSGLPASPNMPPARGSCTSARSRTSSATGSWVTPSMRG